MTDNRQIIYNFVLKYTKTSYCYGKKTIGKNTDFYNKFTREKSPCMDGRQDAFVGQF